MHDPFITALNTQRAALEWFDELAVNLGNIYTPGYRAHKVNFSDYLNGVQTQEMYRNSEQGKSMPGRAPSNLFIEGKGYFVMRTNDSQLRYTRLGDFQLNAEGTLVNDRGWKVQGYLLDENGNAINTVGPANANGNGSPYSPNMAKGGPAQTPTMEVNLWIDPSNGKFYGKYDEYKVQSDGTVMGVADNGKVVTPLYRIALADFTNPGALREVEEYAYVPTDQSGEPMAGSGEVRSGLLEMSNVSLKENVSYLQQAKLQLDVTSKLINTNKNLLEEALRLIQ